MQVDLVVSANGKSAIVERIPQEFLDLGVNGLRAYCFSIGDTASKDQISKGNELQGIFVDGYGSRPASEMKRNIVWEFGASNRDQLKRAVQEAIDSLFRLSNQYAAEGEGNIANSWMVYINGKPATIADLDNVKPGRDDVRVTSHQPYARFLESGKWAGDHALNKRLKRAKGILKSHRFRRHVAVTKTVGDAIARKYKSIAVSDRWYENNPFGYNFGAEKWGKASTRWPAIVFNLRKRF